MIRIPLIFFFVQILLKLFAQNDLIIFKNEKKSIECTVIEKWGTYRVSSKTNAYNRFMKILITEI
jgi:hypothetical protein